MKTYRVTAIWEMFKFVSGEVKAASELAAKKKFRKRYPRGAVTGCRVDLLP